MRLLLLHGLPLGGRMWDDLAPASCSAWAPTLYGLGASVVDWAQALLEQCRGDELLVVGHSVGGSCALELARAAAPDQVRGIVLVGTKAAVRRDLPRRDDAVRVLRGEGVEAAWDRYWAPLFNLPAGPAAVRARGLALEQDVDQLVAGVRAFHERPDRSRFLRTWPGPVTVVSGSDDQTPTPAVAARLLGQTHHQVIIENAGHYVPLEQPEALRRILREHWQRLSAD